MRILATLLISLPGGIAAFFLTLIALDTSWLEIFGATPANRIAAFASPGLAQAAADDLATLRPIPVAIEGGAGGVPSLAVPALDAPPAGPAKTAWVPPITRRAPVDPAVAPAPEAPAAALADAKQAPTALPGAGPATFDTSSRSALGGPRGAAVIRPRPVASSSAATASGPAPKPQAIKKSVIKTAPPAPAPAHDEAAGAP